MVVRFEGKRIKRSGTKEWGRLERGWFDSRLFAFAGSLGW